jgi:hypothetical protein
MSVSLYEHFVSQDWEGASQRAGRLAPAVAIVIGILSLLMGSGFLISLWTILAGVVVGQFEIPALFVMIPHAAMVQETMNEKLRLTEYLPRALTYFLVSYGCWRKMEDKLTICMWAGLYLDGCAVLNAFAHVNKQDDMLDGIAPAATRNGEEDDALNGNKKQPADGAFGTFAV